MPLGVPFTCINLDVCEAGSVPQLKSLRASKSKPLPGGPRRRR
jgi:hypothetical protein